MKIYVFLVCICYALTLPAQSPPDSALDVQILHMTEHLDFSSISSGHLLDRGFKMSNVEDFDGTLNSDTIKNYNTWFYQFGTIVTSNIDSTNNLGETADWKTDAQNLMADDIIPLMVLHAEYHKFKEDSLLLSTLLYEQNGQFYDYPNQSTSPYEAHELISFSPRKSGLVDKLTCDFKLESNFYITNTNKVVSTTEIDFDNGQGYQFISSGLTKKVSWSTYGAKTFKIRLTYADSSRYYGFASFKLIDSSGGLPKTIEGAPDTTFYISHPSISNHGAKVSIAYGCGNDNELRKPFIYVEGFNPPQWDTVTYYTFYEKLFEYQVNFDQGPQLLDDLNLQGYDFVFIDFDRGDGDLLENAETVRKVIKKINEIKAANCSNYKNMLVGYSMGGIVARLALTSMEAANEDHQVDYYVSVDSPHLGANVPRGIIESVIDAAHYDFLGFDLTEDIDAIQDAYDVLMSPAAKQMLMYSGEPNVPHSVFNSYHINGHGPTYESFQAHLDSTGMPLQTFKNITIAKGNGNGVGQGFGSLSNLININMSTFAPDCGNYYLSDLGGIVAGVRLWSEFGAFAHVKLDINAMPGYTATPYQIYERKTRIIFLGIPLQWETHRKKAHFVYSFDGEAGAVFNMDEFGGGGDGQLFQEILDGEAEPCIEFHHGLFSFMPTVSALNLPIYKYSPNTILDLNALHGSSNARFDMMHMLDPTAYVPVTAPDNESHPSLSPSNILPLSNIVTPDFNTPNDDAYISSYVLNLGYGSSVNKIINSPDRITNTFTINGTNVDNGGLCINCTGKVGVIDSTDPESVENTASDFAVEFAPYCGVGNGKVRVQEHGFLRIGESASKTGSIVVREGSWIELNEGVIEIRENSKLIISDGGILRLNSGSVKVFDGGQIIIKEGGKLIYEDGVSIELNGNDAELALGGLTHIGDNATFGFTYQGTESGYIRMLNEGHWGERFSAGVDAEFKIEGEGKTDLILYMEEDVDFWEYEGAVDNETYTSNRFKYVEFRSGLIQMEDDARIVLKDKAKFYDTRVERTDYQNDPRGIVHFRRLNIANSDLYHVDIKSELYYHDEGALVGTDSDFEKCQIDVRGYGFYMRDCYFKYSPIYSWQCTITNQVSKCLFEYGTSGVTDFSTTELTVTNSEFRQLDFGVSKGTSRATIKCSKFTDNEKAVYGDIGGELNLSTLYNGGYNYFNNNDYNIFFKDAAELILEDGYNELYDANVMNIDGTMDLPQSPCPSAINADNNIWTPHSGIQPGYVWHPDYNEFDVRIESPNTGGVPPTVHCQIGFYYGKIEASIATCGEHDRPVKGDDGPKSDDTDSLIVFPFINSPFYFEDVPFDFAVKYTAYNTTIGDSINGDDALAADMYYELLAQSEMDSVTNDSLALVIESMKWNSLKNYKATVERLFIDGTLSPEENSTSFQVEVQQYVDVLMLFTDSVKTTENYNRQFQLEMAKSSLFRNIGKKDKALQILTNIDFCDHDSLQKIILDTEIQSLTFDLLAEEAGTSLYLVDSVTFELDSTIFDIPLANMIDSTGFGSYIISPISILFSSCNSASYQSRITQGNNNGLLFTVYPNPSQHEFFVSLLNGTLENESVLTIQLFDLAGKLVLQEKLNEFQTRVEISHLPNSMYLYQITANDKPLQQGKMSIAH